MSAAAPAVHATYLALVRRFPLRPIRSEKEYDAAGEMLDRLAVREEATLNAGERDYLETLELLIEAYDAQHVAIPERPLTPLGWLKSLMASAGTTPRELQRILGMSQPQVSLILNGKRGLSKASILKLAAHFHVDPSVFIASSPPRKPRRQRRSRPEAAHR